MEGYLNETVDSVTTTWFAELQRTKLQFPDNRQDHKQSRAAIDLNTVERCLDQGEETMVLIFKGGNVLTFKAPNAERDAWLDVLDAYLDETEPRPIPDVYQRACELCLSWLDRRVSECMVEDEAKQMAGQAVGDSSRITGMFRLSGPRQQVTEILYEMIVNEGRRVDETWDIHAMATVLKTLLRRMPETLLTNSLFDTFIQAGQANDVNKLTALVSNLPSEHQLLLQRLMRLCRRLGNTVRGQRLSKMASQALATCLGPVLCPTDEAQYVSQVGHSMPALFHCLISHYNTVFDIDDDEDEDMIEGPASSSSSASHQGPISGLESKGMHGVEGIRSPVSSPYDASSASSSSSLPAQPPLPALPTQSQPSSSSSAPASSSSSAPDMVAIKQLQQQMMSLLLQSAGGVRDSANDVAKTMKEMESAAALLVRKHWKGSLKTADFASTLMQMASLENYSTGLRQAINAWSEALLAENPCREEVMSHLRHRVEITASRYPPLVQHFKQAVKQHKAAHDAAVKTQRSITIMKAKNQSGSKLAKAEDELAAQQNTVRHTSELITKFQMQRSYDTRQMLNEVIESHLFLYAKSLEGLTKVYQRIQSIDSAADAQRLRAELEKREHWASEAEIKGNEGR